MDEEDEFTRFFQVSSGPLVRVVAIGRAIGDSDVTVELIALEVRAAGSILHWRAHQAREQVSDDLEILGDIDTVVTDDVGTVYQVFPSKTSGTGRELRGELIITPVSPAEMTRMRVQMRGFDTFFPGPSRDGLQGAWEFEFATNS